jgi:predicted  nucleic acid-binding Zn-ribbon protein
MKKLEAVDTSSIHAKGIIEVESLEAKYKHLNNERKKLMPKQFQMTKDRELYTEETFREVMLSIKKEIEFLELQISTIESQIHEISKRKSNYTFLDEMITKIKTINLDNIVEVRSLFHELIDNIEIVDKDTISKIKYRYTFN